ncbi:MAG: hypothetical protein R2734_01240 [Nocardioides sp.]
MDITLHSSSFHCRPRRRRWRSTAACSASRIRLDVGQGTMRWITVGAPDQPDVNLVWTSSANPGISTRRRTIARWGSTAGTCAVAAATARASTPRA